MNIEQFVAQSEGKWRSMRSGHSLAFQQFEDVLSQVEITRINTSDTDIAQLLVSSNLEQDRKVSSPFRMTWAAESDWEPDDTSLGSSGSQSLSAAQVIRNGAETSDSSLRLDD
jgi:phycoerythrin-associated linker protein